MKMDAHEARQLFAQCDFLALATQSQRLPGFPFVSHAPFARDGAGRALLLLSRLAEHSRNLATDPRCSAMASIGSEDPQAQPRVTLMGELREISPGPALQDRYLRYHPEAGAFMGFGDFRFYRLEPLRVRMVGGFARAGWIEAADWLSPALDERQEARMLGELAGAAEACGSRLIGLDREGLDLRDVEQGRRRIAWAQRVDDDATLFERAHAALRGLS